jgi:hypothetical protein
VVVSCPADITIFCAESAHPDETGWPEVYDNGSDSEEIAMYTDSIMKGYCEEEALIYRTWTFADECGNEASSCFQVIKVECHSCVEIVKEVIAGPTATG